MAQETELFHSPDSTAFADIQVNGHRETWPVRNKGFRRWLARRFYEETGGAPNSEALQSALNVIEAKAHFDGPEREVHLRIGSPPVRFPCFYGIDTPTREELIASDASPVGIDAKKTHVIIIHKLVQIEERLERLERLVAGEGT